jgi:hypothetical protein
MYARSVIHCSTSRRRAKSDFMVQKKKYMILQHTVKNLQRCKSFIKEYT